MDLFEVLLGSGGKKRQEYEDFAHRYDQGPPWEGYSDREVLDRYGEVAHKMPAADYEAAVRDAMSRLSPEEQAELLRTIQERTRGRGASVPESRSGAGGGASVGLDDLTRSVRELHEQPGRLREVLTEAPEGQPRGVPGSAGAPGLPGGLEGIFANPLAKAAIAGITAMLVRRMLAPR
jgi:hypothetical protein